MTTAREKKLLEDRDELLNALREAIDHLDEYCCEGFKRSNSSQRRRFLFLIRRMEKEE